MGYGNLFRRIYLYHYKVSYFRCRILMRMNKIIHEHWRDWAAIVYLFLCVVDFFIAPLMWNIGMTMMSDEVKMNTSRWVPLTLQGGAMLHLSFGAILGATSWNKHKEITNGTGDKPDS